MHWDTEKTVNQVVSSGAPRQFHKFVLLFKVDGRIIANFITLYFWRGCSLLDDKHSCAGALGCNWYLPAMLSSSAWQRKCKPR